MKDVNTKNDKVYQAILCLFVWVYVVGFFLSSVLRFAAFDYGDMDLAVYDQIVWQIPRGILFSSV